MQSYIVESFLNSSAQFFKSAWCSNFSKLCDSLPKFYFSLLETVLREGITFLFFRRSALILAIDYS